MIEVAEFLTGEIELLRERLYSTQKQARCLTNLHLLKISKKLDAKMNIQQQLLQHK